MEENKEFVSCELDEVFNKYPVTFPRNHVHRKTLEIHAIETTTANVENVMAQLECVMSDWEMENNDPDSKLFPIDNHEEMKKIFKKYSLIFFVHIFFCSDMIFELGQFGYFANFTKNCPCRNPVW